MGPVFCPRILTPEDELIAPEDRILNWPRIRRVRPPLRIWCPRPKARLIGGSKRYGLVYRTTM